MKIKPLDDRVLVEPVKEEEQTHGRIIIPDTAKEKPRMGVVIAVGTDEDLQEHVKPSNKVIFAKYGGDEFEMDNKELLILSRNDILAIVED
ncbi:MAG: co-chaperone GroES [Calditrichaeota bacterium]|nr:MAG: co-chaperone GroES [Calditrichota bacterium]